MTDPLCGWRYTLIVLDMSVITLGKEMESIVSTAASLVHQSENNMILLVYPVLHSGTTLTTLLAAQRKLEDRLLVHKVSIEAPHTHNM